MYVLQQGSISCTITLYVLPYSTKLGLTAAQKHFGVKNVSRLIGCLAQQISYIGLIFFGRYKFLGDD